MSDNLPVISRHSLSYWLARVGRLSPPLIAHLFVSLFYHNYNNNLLTFYS
nr:MAG TPA: hypothetical protein [Caudoviricetes sp.]